MSRKQLEGTAIGLRTWQTAAGLSIHGILGDYYGADIRGIRWFTQDEAYIPLDLAVLGSLAITASYEAWLGELYTVFIQRELQLASTDERFGCSDGGHVIVAAAATHVSNVGNTPPAKSTSSSAGPTSV